MWDLRFSRRRRCRCRSSVFWSHMDWYVVTNVPEKHTVSIFRTYDGYRHRNRLTEMWGFHGGKYIDISFLSCDAIRSCWWLSMVPRNVGASALHYTFRCSTELVHNRRQIYFRYKSQVRSSCKIFKPTLQCYWAVHILNIFSLPFFHYLVLSYFTLYCSLVKYFTYTMSIVRLGHFMWSKIVPSKIKS
jgi:hypothetical protein